MHLKHLTYAGARVSRVLTLKHLTYLLVLFTALATITGCKTDETKKDSTELLTTGTWIMSAYTIDPPQIVNGAVISDLYQQRPACKKDDLLYFYTNNTYKADEGPTKCNTTDVQNVSGTWAFLNEQTQLRLVVNPDTIIYDLLALEEDRMQFGYAQRDTAGVLHVLRATFIKK